MSTDTACSSSLVGAHLAHQGLLAGEADAAVAGGINIMLQASTTAGICQLQVGGLAGCNCRDAMLRQAGIRLLQAPHLTQYHHPNCLCAGAVPRGPLQVL